MISLWLIGGLFATGVIAWVYIARGTHLLDETEFLIQRLAIIFVGVACLLLGIRLMDASAPPVRILAFFMLGVGAQVILWALGIQLALLGSVPTPSSTGSQELQRIYREYSPRSKDRSELLVLRSRMLRVLGALEAGGGGLDSWDSTVRLLHELTAHLTSNSVLLYGDSPYQRGPTAEFDKLFMALAAAEASRETQVVVRPLRQAIEILSGEVNIASPTYSPAMPRAPQPAGSSPTYLKETR
jgi:hypothetical protein